MARWAPSSASRGGALGRVEAPVTLRGYLLCVFAAFGGILFGYDSGYINGVLAMNYFKQEFGRKYPLALTAPLTTTLTTMQVPPTPPMPSTAACTPLGSSR
jgi:hypothetical protein